MNEQKATVDTPCLAYTAMQKKEFGWEVLDALISGTKAMRSLGKEVLPKAEKESEKHFQERCDMSFLYGAYKGALRNISSKPFSKPVSVAEQEKLPEQLSLMIDDIDGQGSSLTQFAAQVFWKALHRGLTHILVDYPRTDSGDGKKPSLAQEKRQGLKPKLIHLPPENLISWTIEGGKLTEIRFKVDAVEKDGEWGERVKEQIYVYRPGSYHIYEKVKGSYVLATEGVVSFNSGIPLTTVYFNKTGEMTGFACLNELAEVNIEHFQSDSDQRNGLHYTRFPFLAMTGLSQQEMDEPVVIGPSHFLRSTNPDAKFYWCEHSGESLAIGDKDLERLEMRMQILGSQPLTQKSGNQTATGKAIDQANNDSDAQIWVRNTEQGLYNAFGLAAQWVGQKLPEKFSVDIFNEFSLAAGTIDDMKVLQQSRLSGDLTRESYLYEMKRRGLLAETFDIAAEIVRLDAEGQNLGSIGRE